MTFSCFTSTHKDDAIISLYEALFYYSFNVHYEDLIQFNINY